MLEHYVKSSYDELGVVVGMRSVSILNYENKATPLDSGGSGHTVRNIHAYIFFNSQHSARDILSPTLKTEAANFSEVLACINAVTHTMS